MQNAIVAQLTHLGKHNVWMFTFSARLARRALNVNSPALENDDCPRAFLTDIMIGMPPSERDACRPVKRRTRTFRPNYVSFAGTYQCNLTCPHCCVPIEWTDRLDVKTALRFLGDAYAYGIRLLGSTGGEPFLYPEFLYALCRRAAHLGFRFDKIVTNGVWFRG